MSTSDRDLINRALWSFRPTTPEGKTVRDLTLLCERLLAERNKLASSDADLAGLVREIDDAGTTLFLVWADRLEEGGEDARVCEALRDLARKGKRPGRVAESYRWSAESAHFGGGASWVLPVAAYERLVWRSQHLGGKEKGRFATLSSAMLAAARVLAGKGVELPPAEPEGGHTSRSSGMMSFSAGDLEEIRCACPMPCGCNNQRCCRCSRLKREA